MVGIMPDRLILGGAKAMAFYPDGVSTYASGDFTGGNLQLNKLVEREGAGYIEKNFEYLILEIFDLRATSNDVIRREHWWMDTLWSVYSKESPFGYHSQREREQDK